MADKKKADKAPKPKAKKPKPDVVPSMRQRTRSGARRGRGRR
jgi:hypothetical protein